MSLAPFMPLVSHKNPLTNDPFDNSMEPITKGAGIKLMKVPNAIFDKDQTSSAISRPSGPLVRTKPGRAG